MIGDLNRLRQIIINLIGNAIKFTECGRVGLRIALDSRAQDELRLHFVVTDTGVGIAAEKQQLDLRRFLSGRWVHRTQVWRHRAGPEHLLAAGGVDGREDLGGEHPRGGSSFHFTASMREGREVGNVSPAAPANLTGVRTLVVEPDSAMPGTRQTVPKGTKKLRVLMAEDNAVNQKIACGVLEKQGHDVTQAWDGCQALAALDRAHFDVVLMDVQMPEMDGFETTAAIRARERDTGRHLPIIAMTAHAMEGDRERCIAAGMDSYLSKPLKVPELIELLEKFCDATQ